MRPDLVPYAQAVEATPDWIRYESQYGEFFNDPRGVAGGERHYTSMEMLAYRGTLPLPEKEEALRVEFAGKVVPRG